MNTRWATTEIIREDNGLDYDVQTHFNFDYAGKKLSDKRQWKDIVAAEGWDEFRRAVKTGQLPKPVVSPIRRAAC